MAFSLAESARDLEVDGCVVSLWEVYTTLGAVRLEASFLRQLTGAERDV